MIKYAISFSCNKQSNLFFIWIISHRDFSIQRGSSRHTPLAATSFLTSGLVPTVNTGNPFADAILAMVLILFTLYFNIVYIIRHWVIIAVLAATPIIIWIWILSQERNVIYLWFAELVQTIFIQSAHALTFAVVFSILCFNPAELARKYLKALL